MGGWNCQEGIAFCRKSWYTILNFVNRKRENHFMDDVAPLFQQTLGPMGRDVAPAGDASFSELVSAYSTRLRPGEGPVHVNCMTTMAECPGRHSGRPGEKLLSGVGFLGL